MLTNDRKPLTQSLNFWFGMLLFIGPIHMTEQLLFGLDELQELKTLVARYYGRFADPDIGTWWLVVMTATLVQLLMYGLLAGGRWRLAAAGFLGVFAISELHHIIRSMAAGAYNPGVVTCFAFIGIGWMMLKCVREEWGASRPRAV